MEDNTEKKLNQVAPIGHRWITVYTAVSDLQNPRLLLSGMWRDTFGYQARDLARRLLIRNVSAMYRQSILGILWLFVPPIATTLIWVFLNKQDVVAIGATAVPYPLFLLTGNLVWQGFSTALGMPMQVLLREKPLLTKQNFSREALLVAGFYEAIVNTAIPMMILLPILFWYKVPLSGWTVLAPVGILAILLFGYALGIFLAPAGLLFGDVAKIVPFITQFWFFLTPVVYPPPTQGLAAGLAKLNPVSPLIIAARDCLTGQPPTTLVAAAGVTTVAIIGLAIGFLGYRLAMPHVIERLSA